MKFFFQKMNYSSPDELIIVILRIILEIKVNIFCLGINSCFLHRSINSTISLDKWSFLRENGVSSEI